MTINIPTEAAELQALMMDREKFDSEVYKDPKNFAQFINNYAKAVNKADKNIEQQVGEQVQAAMASFIKDNKDAEVNRPDQTPKMQNSLKTSHGKSYNAKALGAALDGEFTSPHDFFDTINHLKDRRGEVVSKRLDKIRNALGSTVPADGGFLIPETLRTELLREALETAIVRPRARVIPMESLRVPIPALDSTSNSSSVFGGITAYWTEEAAALVNSSPTFARVVLEAKKLTAYTEIPNELMSDSAISFDALISQMFPEALAWFEDVGFLQGSGVGEPLGVFNVLNNALVAVAKETAQATASIVWENIVKMYARMLPAVLNRAVWIASIDTFPELATMALAVGTAGSAIWLNNGQDGPPMTILGRPVIFTEKTSVLGSQGDINFVDFGHYLVGDRQAMTAMSSPHYKFGNDVTAFRIIERVDGRPWLQTAITPKNGGPTLTPFVQLAAR